jgi:muramoyltetrapeptide carboxypeptidase
MWSYLNKGDVVDIITTTPGIAKATLEKDLQLLCLFINKLGLEARYNLQDIYNGADFFSSSAQQVRQDSLSKALLAKDSKAIWIIRGGYGTAKLLPQLHALKKPSFNKLVIGYSDINCLHIWLHKFWNWTSLHYRVLYEYLETQDQVDIDKFKDIIFGKSEIVNFSNLSPLNDSAKCDHNIIAKITGGTVQVIQSGIGLPWQLDSVGKILFFEEIFDRAVRLDRSLYHFTELGLFNQAKAIIFGDIICGAEVNGLTLCDQAIKYFADSLKIPVFSLPNIGHGALNYPLPLNSQAKLIVKNYKAQLICTTGGMI